MKRTLLVSLPTLLTVLILGMQTGCGPSGPDIDTFPVSGVVKLNGVPVEGAGELCRGGREIQPGWYDRHDGQVHAQYNGRRRCPDRFIQSEDPQAKGRRSGSYRSRPHGRWRYATR